MTDPHRTSSEGHIDSHSVGSKELFWWQELPAVTIDDVLGGINSSRQRKQSIDRRNDLLNALAKIRQALIQFRVANERPDKFGGANLLHLDVVESAMATTDLDGLFDTIFDHPSHRLAVYGSLKPGGSNAAQMSGIKGDWRDGTVHGIVEQPGEYLEFTWDVSAPPVSVMVFASPQLPEHFHRLDEFEGPDYLRTLVPVSIEGAIHVCNIYEGKRRKKTHA